MSIALPFKRFRYAERAIVPVPLSLKTRVAALNRCKLNSAKVKYFATGSPARIEAFHPNILVGAAAQLEQLTGLSTVDIALLVTTVIGSSVLTDVRRVVLWQMFGVPVYELLVSADGKIIASECEAHEGWHIAPGTRFAHPSTARIEPTACECGRNEHRIFIDESQSDSRCGLAAIA